MTDRAADTAAQEWKHYFVGYGLLRQEGSVLLVGNRWRWDPSLPLVWTLPGGRAEAGESVLAAAQREFREETGLSVELGSLLWVSEYFDPDGLQHFVSFVFDVLRAEGQLDFSGDENVIDARFVAEPEITDYLSLISLREPLLAYLCAPQTTPKYYQRVRSRK